MKSRAILTVLSALAAGAILTTNNAIAAEPEIDVQHKGNKITLTFTGTLQESSDAVNWKTVNASSPYDVTISKGIKFYRAMSEEEAPVEIEVVWCPPGTFTMGSPTDEFERWPDEVQHQVTLTGFYIGKYEVTQAQYTAVMGTNPSKFKGANLPVEMVTWNDATNFCAKLTAREKAAGRLPRGYVYSLPTEAQWEYACRAGTTSALNSGKELTDYRKCPNVEEVAWYYYDSDGKTHPGGGRKPNAWGIYDMHGNVWEWCLDWFGDYPSSALKDPTGPASGSKRVRRGACWFSDASFCRSACRGSMLPDKADDYSGFRVALVPEPEPPPASRVVPISDTVSMVLNRCPAGGFRMGSPKDEVGRSYNETQHYVLLSKDFYIGKYEVTQAQYEALMGKNPSEFKGADLPVEMVSWEDAMAFCDKLTAKERAAWRLPAGYVYSLPTEAQWEYACRAGTTTALNSGKNLTYVNESPEMNEVGWYGYNSGHKTHPVGEKKANAWGMYDMHGNVWEWCLDWYDVYPSRDAKDPTGPESGSVRVLRGGSWYSPAGTCRSAQRGSNTPDYRGNYNGFRVALIPE